MTHVTSRLTAKNRDRLRNPTLGNRVWATFTFLPSTDACVQYPSGGILRPTCRRIPLFKSDVFDVLNVFILTFLHRGNYFYVMLFSDLLVVSVSVTKKNPKRQLQAVIITDLTLFTKMQYRPSVGIIYSGIIFFIAVAKRTDQNR